MSFYLFIFISFAIECNVQFAAHLLLQTVFGLGLFSNETGDSGK
jgi:hypothetical protein